MGAPLRWILCSPDTFPSFFEHFHVFWYLKILPQPPRCHPSSGSDRLSKSSRWSPSRGTMFGTKLWAQTRCLPLGCYCFQAPSVDRTYPCLSFYSHHSMCIKNRGKFPVAQRVKEPVLPQLWCRPLAQKLPHAVDMAKEKRRC